jgi:hypothetical protein
MGRYDPERFINRDTELRGFRKLLQPNTPQAIMRIWAEEWMGKTWLIGHMCNHCHLEGGQSLVATIDFKNPREKLQVQDTLSLVRLIRTKLDQPRVFDALNEVINHFTAHAPGASPSALNSLAIRIEDNFSLRELARLSRFLDVTWENLPGETLYEKAYALVAHMQRRGRIVELVDRLAEERDHVAWWQGPESLREARPAPTEGQAVVDRNAPLADGSQGRDLAEQRINEAFFTCLQTLARERPIALLFDGCDLEDDEGGAWLWARTWIERQLLDRLRTGELENVIVILAGRAPFPITQPEIDELVVTRKLDAFGEEEVKQFFAAYHQQVDPEEVPVLARASGGNPGLLAKMLDNLRAKDDSKDPFWDE